MSNTNPDSYEFTGIGCVEKRCRVVLESGSRVLARESVGKLCAGTATLSCSAEHYCNDVRFDVNF